MISSTDEALTALSITDNILTEDQKNQYQVSKEIVELIHVEGDNAYISGTISTGDMVVSGGAEKVIENEILKVN